MFGKYRTRSKSTLPRKIERNGLLYAQTKPKESNQFILTRQFIQRFFRFVAVSGLLALTYLAWLQLSNLLMQHAVSSPNSTLTIEGFREGCDSVQLADFLKKLVPAGGQFDVQVAVNEVARFCKVDHASINLTGLSQLRVELHRAPFIFQIECDPLLDRSLTSAGTIYSSSPAHNVLPLLQGFDRKFCKEEFAGLPMDHPEWAELLESFNQLSGYSERSGHPLSSVKARLPRGFEVRFKDSPHTFVVGVPLNSKQFDRLTVAFGTSNLEPSVIGVDIDGRLVIGRGSNNVSRQ